MEPPPKDQSTQAPSSGEIFSQGRSAYEEAMSAATEDVESAQAEKVTQEQSAQAAAPVQLGEGAPSGPDSYMPPPPFVEDNRKKLIVLVVIVIFILMIVFALISVVRRIGTRPVPKQNVKLTYWGLWEPESVMQPVIDEYIRLHPEVTVDYIQSDPKQYRERLQSAIDRGEGPDIFRYHNTWLPMFAAQLAPLPTSIYSDDEYTSTFYPVADGLKVGDSHVGIPLMIDGLLLFYNEDILKAANVDVPKTWINVEEAVEKLTVYQNERIETSAIALGTADNIEHFSDIFTLMLLQNGTKLNTSMFSCADESYTKCGVDALTYYKKFTAKPTKTWDDTLENSIVAFAGGKVAMIIAPSWQAHGIKTLSPTLNFKTAPVPQLPCENEPCPRVDFATFWVEGVSAKSAAQAASWELLKYLSQKETMQKLYAEEVKVNPLFGEPYSRVDLSDSLSDNIYLFPLMDEAPTMKSFYTATRTNDGETGMNTTLNTYFKNAVNSMREGTSAETALKTAAKGFVQVFTRFNLSYQNPPE